MKSEKKIAFWFLTFRFWNNNLTHRKFLKSHLRRLTFVFIAHALRIQISVQCIYTFYEYLSIPVIKLNTFNKTEKKKYLDCGKFCFWTIFPLFSRWALPLCFHDVMIKWSSVWVRYEKKNKKKTCTLYGYGIFNA